VVETTGDDAEGVRNREIVWNDEVLAAEYLLREEQVHSVLSRKANPA